MVCAPRSNQDPDDCADHDHEPAQAGRETTDDDRLVSPGEEGYDDAFDMCPEPTCPLYGKAVMADHRHLTGRMTTADHAYDCRCRTCEQEAAAEWVRMHDSWGVLDDADLGADAGLPAPGRQTTPPNTAERCWCDGSAYRPHPAGTDACRTPSGRETTPELEWDGTFTPEQEALHAEVDANTEALLRAIFTGSEDEDDD